MQWKHEHLNNKLYIIVHTATIITFFLTEYYGGIEHVMVLDSNTRFFNIIICLIAWYY